MDIKTGESASKQARKKKGGVKMYEVQTKFIYGWENVWMGEDKPIVFKTKKEAQAELKDNVDSWNNDPNTTSKYSYDDYRVVKRGSVSVPIAKQGTS
jgi:hypothetical protein